MTEFNAGEKSNPPQPTPLAPGVDIKPNETRTNLIVNYLPQTLSQKELMSMFSTIGPVKEAKVMMDMKTGYSYGFGFVDYHRTEDAQRAIRSLNGLEVQNKRIKVAFARPPGVSKDTNLYVANLPRHWAEAEVDQLFAPYGNIIQRNILRDKTTGLMRGVAFVRFEHRQEALSAISGLHGTIPEGGTDPLTVKVAEEHGKTRAQYYADPRSPTSGMQAGAAMGGGATQSPRGPMMNVGMNMFSGRGGGPVRPTGRYSAMPGAGPIYQYRPY